MHNAIVYRIFYIVSVMLLFCTNQPTKIYFVSSTHLLNYQIERNINSI